MLARYVLPPSGRSLSLHGTLQAEIGASIYVAFRGGGGLRGDADWRDGLLSELLERLIATEAEQQILCEMIELMKALPAEPRSTGRCALM